MDDKQVVKGLFKKLSALRATLTDEEQVLLDGLLVTDDEVNAHLLHSVKTTAVTTNVDEVAAHVIAMNTNKVTDKLTDKAMSKTTDLDEVVAHGMKAAVTPKVTDKITDAVYTRVGFDKEKEIYVVE